MWKKSEDLHPKLLKCLHLGSLCLSAALWLRGSRPQGYLRIQGGDWRSIHHIWVPNCAKEERKKEGSMNILLAESPSLQQSFQESHMYPLCCSVAKSCPTLCDPMDCSTPGFPVLHYLPELLKLMCLESVMPSNHLILCHPLLLPSVFPSIRVFPKKSAVHIR